MGQNGYSSNPTLTQDQDEMADKPGSPRPEPVKKASPRETQEQPTIEEFGEEGMGIAAKE